MNEVLIRQKYIEKVKPFMFKQLIKVFTGQRRVGKSYILKQLILQIQEDRKDANIIYLNLEDFEHSNIKTADDLNKYLISQTDESKLNCVFIDEIQEVTEFEKVLRSLLLNENYDIYITGSNAKVLSGELATFLGGRYIEIPIYSLSYMEFLNFHGKENNSESLMFFMKYGGLPYLKHLKLEDEIVFGYLKGIYNSIIYRDIIMRAEVRNSAFLENLVVYLSDNIGQIFSAKKIADYLKSQRVNIAASQVINYLFHLNNAYLIHRISRYDLIGKRIFEVGDKFYFEDLGLRNTILNFKLSDIEKLMENAVYHHLKLNNFSVNTGQLAKQEIDFVAKRDGETLYVQVCYLLAEESTIEREFGNLERIKDNYPKIVVSMDEFFGNTRNGIIHKNFREFLSKDL